MVDRLKVLDCQSTCLGRPSSLGGLGFLPRKRFRPGLSRPGEVKDVYVHWVLRLILRWDPLGNWAISTFSGQNPCTRVISSILHSFLRLSNKLYEITPKERFLWEPEKIYFKSFQFTHDYFTFVSTPVKFEISFPGYHKKLSLVLLQILNYIYCP